LKVKTNEKALRETQTLRAGCSKVEPKLFAPPQTPSGGRGVGWLKFNQPVWRGSMHTISSYRDNRPTHKQTHPATNRQDRLQYTAPQLAIVQ